MNHLLFWPLLAYALWIGLIAFSLMFTRLRAVRKREVPAQYFKAYQGGNLPEKMIVLGRHYDNQFQLPMLFFVTGLLALVLNQVTIWTLSLAWIFVVSRWAHSYIHLSSNNVALRLLTFTLGWISVLLMWFELGYRMWNV